MDTLIAAYPLSLNAILIIHNMSEFRQWIGLQLEDWERPSREKRGMGGDVLSFDFLVSKVNN
ncbi:MAG: hypothetical protein HQL55_07750 [Magnetococcales bacterium]|nr:hypothetical protein [Magnetococcales bacterium]